MSYYEGEKCLICNKIFTDSDDIAVCPDCGTPYHRKCYKEKNHCINYALHETNGSWMAQTAEKRKAEESLKKICPECSCLNTRSAEKCVNCGADLVNRECQNIDMASSKVVKIELDSEQEYFGMDATEVMDDETGVTMGEIADYVKDNRLFYMLIFKRLKNASAQISVNLAAILFPQYYCAGRKMFLCTAILLIVRFFLQLPANISALGSVGLGGKAIENFIQLHPINEKVSSILVVLDLTLRIVFGLAANSIYFRHIISKLKKIKGSSPDYIHYRLKVKGSGGISIAAMFVTILADAFLVALLYLVVVVLAYYH